MSLLAGLLRRAAPVVGDSALSQARQRYGRTIAAGAGGALAGAAVSAAAQDEAPDSRLSAVQARVADLEQRDQTFSNVNVADPESVMQAQRLLLAEGIPVRVDGNLGPETAQAIRQFRDRNAQELEVARASLQDAQHQEASRETRAGPARQAARALGPYAGLALGVLAGHGSRSLAVRNVARRLAQANAKADALVTSQALQSPGRNISSRAAANAEAARRSANVNEFWRLGGAKEGVPFAPAQSVTGFSARRNVATASSLFPPGARTLRVPDAAIIGGGAGDAAISTVLLDDAQKELAAAQAAADRDPSEANLARLEQARDQVAVWETAQRLGLGIAAGRTVGTFSHRYPIARPNVAVAEAERKLLNQFLAAQRRRRR